MRLVNAATLLKLLPLAIFVIVGAFATHPEISTERVCPGVPDSAVP